MWMVLKHCAFDLYKKQSRFSGPVMQVSSYRTCPLHGSFLQLVWLIFLAIKLYGFKLHVIN